MTQHPHTGQPQAGQTPVADSRRHLKASIERRTGSRYVVILEDLHLTQTTSKPQAISTLCREAIARNESMTVTVDEGRGRSYLTVTAAGVVRESSPPAPESTRPDLSGFGRRDLGTSPEGDTDTHTWVEDAILDPRTSGGGPTLRATRRWGLRKK